MKVTSLGLNFRQTAQKATKRPVQTSLTMSTPLTHDSVSFGKHPEKVIKPIIKEASKLLESRSDKINIELANNVTKDAKSDFIYLKNIMNKYFKNLCSTDNMPNNPLQDGHKGLKIRTKSEESLAEKSAALRLRNKTEIKKEIGDIIGARLILRDSSPKSIKKVIDSLIKAVKNNDLSIYEIENYSVEPKYAYLNNKQLDSIREIANKLRSEVNVSNKNISSGYTATHFSVILPNSYKAEIQLMGADVERLKEVEDVLYKLKNKKSLPKELEEVEKKYKKLSDNEELKKALNYFTKAQYKYAREKEPKNLKIKFSKKPFLETPGYLPSWIDFNELEKDIIKARKHRN